MSNHWQVGDTVTLETARNAGHYGYALLADDDSVFYIGRTCDPSGRLRSHTYSGVEVIRKRLGECKLKRMRILAGPMTEAAAIEWEREAIQRAEADGFQLLNQESRRPLGLHPRCAAVEYFLRRKVKLG